MTPEKTTIIQSLIAFAWADGHVTAEEEDVVDTMLTAVDATQAERDALKEYAKTERSLDDIPVAQLSADQRELLLTNAAILCRADGEESASESKLLATLGKALEFSDEASNKIVNASSDDALQLPRESLIPIPPPRKKRS